MYFASSNTVLIGVFTALLAALVFGFGDFGSGELGKKMNPYALLSGIYFVEVPLLFVLMLMSQRFGNVQTNLVLFLVGILGTIGFSSMVYGLTKGYASIVMSLSGLLALVVPVIASILIGESSNIFVWVGVVIAVAAIVCVTRVSEPENDHESNVHKKAIRISLLGGSIAGLTLGSYFVGLDQIESSIFPKLFYLQLSGFIFGVIYVALNQSAVVKIRKSFLLLLVIGVGYQIGQMLFPFASERTSLVVTNIIVNLYPAITIVLAKYFNHEKTNRAQHLGFVLAVIGLLLVSFGAT